MKDQEVFEVLKGNVKVLNLTDEIEQQKKKIHDLTWPYLTEKQQQWYGDHFIEPDWPAGQKRVLANKYKNMTEKLWGLQRFKNQIISKVFEDYDEDDEDYTYQVDIKITRSKDTV